jgi:hypothetical protein
VKNHQTSGPRLRLSLSIEQCCIRLLLHRSCGAERILGMLAMGGIQRAKSAKRMLCGGSDLRLFRVDDPNCKFIRALGC